MEALEALQFEVEEQVFGLNMQELQQICPLLDITVTAEQSRPSIVRLVQSSLRKMDIGQDGAEERLRAIKAGLDSLKTARQGSSDVNQEVQALITSHQSKMAQLESEFQEKLRLLEDHLDHKKNLTETPLAQAPPSLNAATVTSAMNAPPLFRKELRISGQIGEPNQKDRLSFTSLNHQIEAALLRGYNETEVIEAVVRAINPGLRLRSYLENHSRLTLTTLRTVLKAHYQEKDATEIYQELSQICQMKGETPQGFVMRALDLKQRVLLASDEATAGLRYDPQLVQSMFLHAVVTGLTNDNIRQDIKQNLSTETTDEELLQRLSAAAALETKRIQKTGLKPGYRVNSVHTTKEEPPASNAVEEQKADAQSVMAAQLAELKACMLAIQGKLAEQPQSHDRSGQRTRNRPPPGLRGCPACRNQGTGDHCRHCYKCGGDDHYALGCRKGAPRKPNSGNGPGGYF